MRVSAMAMVWVSIVGACNLSIGIPLSLISIALTPTLVFTIAPTLAVTQHTHTCTQMIILKAVRQWCRIFSAPERFLARESGPEKMLIDFFVVYPVGRCICSGARRA